MHVTSGEGGKVHGLGIPAHRNFQVCFQCLSGVPVARGSRAGCTAAGPVDRKHVDDMGGFAGKHCGRCCVPAGASPDHGAAIGAEPQRAPGTEMAAEIVGSDLIGDVARHHEAVNVRRLQSGIGNGGSDRLQRHLPWLAPGGAGDRGFTDTRDRGHTRDVIQRYGCSAVGYDCGAGDRLQRPPRHRRAPPTSDTFPGRMSGMRGLPAGDGVSPKTIPGGRWQQATAFAAVDRARCFPSLPGPGAHRYKHLDRVV